MQKYMLKQPSTEEEEEEVVRVGGGLCFSLLGLTVGEREEMIRRRQWGRDREEKEVKGERGGPTALLFMPALEQRAYNGLRPQHHS